LADPQQALAEGKPDMAEESPRGPASACLGAVDRHRVRAGPPGHLRCRRHVPRGWQFHPDPGSGVVVAHQADLLPQDLLGEGAGAAAAQDLVAAENRVDKVRVGQSFGCAGADQRHPAQPWFGSLSDLELERQPARLQQR
jgi:hypothetical protein